LKALAVVNGIGWSHLIGQFGRLVEWLLLVAIWCHICNLGRKKNAAFQRKAAFLAAVVIAIRSGYLCHIRKPPSFFCDWKTRLAFTCKPRQKVYSELFVVWNDVARIVREDDFHSAIQLTASSSVVGGNRGRFTISARGDTIAADAHVD
jgi:hypothetical protein